MSDIIGLESALLSQVLDGDPALVLSGLLFSCFMDNGKSTILRGVKLDLGQKTGYTKIATTQLICVSLGSITKPRVVRALSVLEALSVITTIGKASLKSSTVYRVNFDVVLALRKSVMKPNQLKIHEIWQTHFPQVPVEEVKEFVRYIYQRWQKLGGEINTTKVFIVNRIIWMLDSYRITFPALKATFDSYITAVESAKTTPCKLKTYFDNNMWEMNYSTGSVDVQARLLFMGEAELPESTAYGSRYVTAAKKLRAMWNAIGYPSQDSMRTITRALIREEKQGTTLATILEGAEAYTEFVNRTPVMRPKDVKAIWSFLADAGWTVDWDRVSYKEKRKQSQW